MKNNSHGSILSKLVIGIGLIIVLLLLLFSLQEVKGSDNSIFKNNQIYLSEKVSYLFRKPSVGDAITFTVNDAGWIGLITQIQEGEALKGQNTTIYTVVTNLQPKNPWLITKDKITSRIIYPPINISQNDLDNINNTLSLPNN